jgi:ABC-type Mn2+/Zn2+ transport system ATPase subunit
MERDRMPDTPIIIAATDLSLGYGSKPVLSGLTLEIRTGEFWFLLGTNGAGKTTLLRAVMGLLPPRRGGLQLHPTLAARERIGFVPQRCDLNPTVPTTVREFVSLGFVGTRMAREERAAMFAQALAIAGLTGREAADYRSLSGGLRQRALIARALVRRPTLLVLDEPTNGLDPASEDAVLELLARLNREQQVTVVFVTHDLDLASGFATHVALLHGGQLTAGPRDAMLQPATLERIFGAPQRPRAEGPHYPGLGGHV